MNSFVRNCSEGHVCLARLDVRNVVIVAHGFRGRLHGLPIGRFVVVALRMNGNIERFQAMHRYQFHVRLGGHGAHIQTRDPSASILGRDKVCRAQPHHAHEKPCSELHFRLIKAMSALMMFCWMDYTKK